MLLDFISKRYFIHIYRWILPRQKTWIRIVSECKFRQFELWVYRRWNRRYMNERIIIRLPLTDLYFFKPFSSTFFMIIWRLKKWIYLNLRIWKNYHFSIKYDYHFLIVKKIKNCYKQNIKMIGRISKSLLKSNIVINKQGFTHFLDKTNFIKGK